MSNAVQCAHRCVCVYISLCVCAGHGVCVLDSLCCSVCLEELIYEQDFSECVLSSQYVCVHVCVHVSVSVCVCVFECVYLRV